jgi:hypothetical protein
MKRVERANRIITKVQETFGLTEDGKNWLITALDPMHDERLRLEGYPDRENGPSLIQMLKQSKTYAKPAAITAPWNLSILADNDMLNSSATDVAVTTNRISYTGAGDFYPMGGVTAVASSSGYAGPLHQVTLAGTTVQLAAMNISGQLTGRMRVISVGFEAVNTTPELYKSGALAVYEQTSSLSNYQTWQDTDGVNSVYTTAVSDHVPPSTVADALNLNGTQQWDAAEGAYCVLNQAVGDNLPCYVNNISRVFTSKDAAGPTPSGASYHAFYDHATNPNEHFIVPFNRKGMLITGLSAESTFTVNYNVVLETFPAWSNSLVLLATPSACNDPKALELYSHITCRLPVGVRFADNGLGDWFLGVADTIADVASQIGRPILGALESYQLDRKQRSVPPNSWVSHGDMSKDLKEKQIKEQPIVSKAKAKPKQSPPRASSVKARAPVAKRN